MAHPPRTKKRAKRRRYLKKEKFTKDKKKSKDAIWLKG
jgi:hypothetical protein